jgi:hypothetical protein
MKVNDEFVDWAQIHTATPEGLARHIVAVADAMAMRLDNRWPRQDVIATLTATLELGDRVRWIACDSVSIQWRDSDSQTLSTLYQRDTINNEPPEHFTRTRKRN